jgi:uncharacterized protein DUF1566
MKKFYLSLIVIGALIAFLPVAAMAAGGSGFPTWSSKLTKGRFTVLPLLSSLAVFDKETGLVWEQSPSTSTFNWFGALVRCSPLEVGGRKGWRLPTIEELASLVDTSQPNPSLPLGHPFNIGSVQSSFYWSATADALESSDAWGVDFGNGAVSTGDKSLSSAFVWCVRGAQGIDGDQ